MGCRSKLMGFSPTIHKQHLQSIRASVFTPPFHCEEMNLACEHDTSNNQSSSVVVFAFHIHIVWLHYAI